MTVALDAWAIVELVKGSAAGAEVAELLETERPVMSWINLGEVFYGFQREQGEDEAISIVRDVCDLVEALPPDPDDVLAAGRIKSEYRLSYADAFAAATAAAYDAILWTGDPELLLKDAPWSWKDLRRPKR